MPSVRERERERWFEDHPSRVGGGVLDSSSPSQVPTVGLLQSSVTF